MGRHYVLITKLRIDGNTIYARGLVMSETRPGTWYEVRAVIDRVPIGGTYWVRIVGKCTCPASQYGWGCKHVLWLANKAIARARAMSKARAKQSGPHTN